MSKNNFPVDRKNKKTVSFREVEKIEISNSNPDVIRSNTKKMSILKGKGKKNNEELKEEKIMESVEEMKEEEEKEEEIKTEIPYQSSNDSNNKMKYLSTDDYFKATIQTDLEQGLLNMAMLRPKNPIKFLGNYLLEKSKSYKL